MKLVFFIHSLSIGGAERVTTTLANYWASKGWNVLVVTMAPPSGDDYIMENGARRITLNLAINSGGVGSALLNNIRRIAAMRRMLTKEKPDVAIGVMSTPSILLSLAAIGTSTVTIGAERVYPPRAGLNRFWGMMRRLTYGGLHCVIAQTQGSADWIKKNTFARCTCVIPNPVQLPLPVHTPVLAPSSILSRGYATRVLLCAGRLVQQKRFDKILDAFAQLADKHPQWRLVIIGEGPLRSALTDRATRLNIADRVFLPGIVGNPSDWYQSADIYALTSDYEGFPNTLLEAMAHGTPSIAIDCETGPRDLIEDEVNGLLISRNDDSALLKALDRCMSDKDLRERLGKNAAQASKRYEISQIADGWSSAISRFTAS